VTGAALTAGVLVVDMLVFVYALYKKGRNKIAYKGGIKN